MRWLAKCLAVVVVVMVLLATALGGALRRDDVASRFADWIGVVASSDTLTVSLKGLDTSSPFAPKLALLELGDHRGVWLRLQGLSVEVAPWPLLARLVLVRSISATRIEFPRLPELDEDPFTLRPQRLVVRVDRLHAGELLLGRELLGEKGESEFAVPIVVDAAGKVDLRRLTLNAELVASTATLDDLLVGTGVRSSTARLSVTAKGSLARPGGVVTLSAGNLEAGDLRAAGIDIRADIERLGHGERSYAVKLDARLDDVTEPASYGAYLGTDPSLVAELRFGATPMEFELRNARLEGAAFAAEFGVETKDEATLQITQAVVTVPDLKVLPAFADQVSAGALRLRATGEIHAWNSAPDVHVNVTGESLGLALADPRLDTLAGPKVRWAAELEQKTDRWPDVKSFRLSAAAASAEGRLRVLADDRIEGTVQVVADDLRAFSALVGQETVGAARVKAEIAGSVAAPEIRVEIASPGLQVGGAGSVEGELVANASRDADVWSGKAVATLSAGGEAVGLDLAGRFDPEQGRVHVETFRISVPGSVVTADGEFDLETGLARGRVRLRSTDLASAGRIVMLSLSGSADVTCKLDHDGNTQGGDLSAAVRSFRSGDLALDHLNLDATRTGRTRQTTYRIDAEGDWVHRFSVRGSGSHRGDLERAELDFTEFSGDVGGHPFSVETPLRFRLNGREVELREGTLAVAGGRVEGRWRGDMDRGVGKFRFEQLSLSLIDLIRTDLRFSGRVTGELSRQSAGSRLDLRLNTLGAGIPSPSGRGDVSPFDLQLSAAVAARRSIVEAAIRETAGESGFDLKVDAPAGTAGVDSAGALEARLNGTLAAALVGQFLLPPDDRIAGAITFDILAGGTLETPKIDGRIHGAVDYLNAATGMDVRIEDLDLRGKRQRIDVVSLRGHDANGGRFAGTGFVEIAPDWREPRLALNVSIEDFHLAKIDEVLLRADGTVALTAEAGTFSLKGDLAADQAIVRIPNRLPPDIATLPVDHVNLISSRSGMGRAIEETPGQPLRLDVALRFPSRLRVEDPNLDSEWRGKIVIGGDTSDVDVLGSLEVVRGTIALGGMRFRAREGKLSFDEAENVPVLKLTAVTVKHDIEATLRLAGRLDRLEFTLTSEPPLPQDEILSRLMFGSTATALTPGQAVQLAQILQRLSGHGSQIDIMSRVRRFAGVDRVEIKDTEDSGTAVSVGKYVTDRVYVSVDQSVAGEGSKARVEVEISEHIAAETEVGQNENARIGVKWRWNY